MSKTETANPKSAKAQDAVERTIKANQAAAETAVKVGKETAEKALKASSEAVTKAYDQAYSAAKETVQKAFPAAAARFEELASLQRANLEAFFSAGSAAMKGVEAFSEEVLALNRKALEESVSGAKKLAECRTVQDVVELQAEFAKAHLESMLAQGTKLTDLAIKVAGDVVGPMQARLGEAVEKMGRPLGA